MTLYEPKYPPLNNINCLLTHNNLWDSWKCHKQHYLCICVIAEMGSIFCVKELCVIGLYKIDMLSLFWMRSLEQTCL